MTGTTRREQTNRGGGGAQRSGRGGGSGGGGGRGRQDPSREIQISKALSFLLRHGAKDAGVELDDGGWANLADVVSFALMPYESIPLSAGMMTMVPAYLHWLLYLPLSLKLEVIRSQKKYMDLAY